MTIYSKITNKFFVRNNLKKAEKVEDLRLIGGITEETVDVFYMNQNKAEVEKGIDGILDHVSYKREQSVRRQLDKLDKLLEVLYKLTRELDEDLNKLENKTIIQVGLEQDEHADFQPAKLPEIDSVIEKKAKETNFSSEPVRCPNKLKNIKTVDPQNNYSPKSKKDSVSSNKKVCLFAIGVAAVLATIIIAVYYSTLVTAAIALLLFSYAWLVYNDMFKKTNGPNSTLEEPREEKTSIQIMESI